MIFDLDGTLLDTLSDIHSVVSEVLAVKDFPPRNIEQVRMAVGRGVVHLSRCLLPQDTPEPDVVRIGHLIADIYLERGSVLTRVYDGVHEMLGRLDEVGMPMAVLTNKPQLSADECIQRYFPDVRFRTVRGVRPGKPVKPHPDSAVPVLAALGSPAGETAMVGDSDVDMRTASSAGLHPIGVSWGFRERSLLLKHGARFVADHPEEVCQYLLADDS